MGKSNAIKGASEVTGIMCRATSIPSDTHERAR